MLAISGLLPFWCVQLQRAKLPGCPEGEAMLAELGTVARYSVGGRTSNRKGVER